VVGGGRGVANAAPYIYIYIQYTHISYIYIQNTHMFYIYIYVCVTVVSKQLCTIFGTHMCISIDA